MNDSTPSADAMPADDQFQIDTPIREVEAIARVDAVPTILEVVCRTTGMGFAAVARVTEDRWIACAVRDLINFGLKPGGELKVETTICNEIRDSGQLVVIDHVEKDQVFCRHPTPEMYGFQSYISVPIRLPTGEFFGTLCAIDPKPNKLNTPEVVGMFRLFADLIGFQLEAQDRLVRSEVALLNERQAVELREQFMAVLGHDLRNPLAAIDAGTMLLSKAPLTANERSILRLVRDSVQRMATLIDNVLDLARSRLGGGLALNRTTAPLGPVIEQVIAELRAAWPDRAINTDIACQEPMNCDHPRIGRLLSNLVANALVHGQTDKPVYVRAKVTKVQLVLSVANAGKPIPRPVMDRLFQPFFRGPSESITQGLGLGLYIASQIAKAHGGDLSVISTPDETRFTLTLPYAGSLPLGPPDGTAIG